jgi:hypothetical protein
VGTSDNIAQSDFKQRSGTTLSHEESRWCNVGIEVLTPATYVAGVFVFSGANLFCQAKAELLIPPGTIVTSSEEDPYVRA